MDSLRFFRRAFVYMLVLSFFYEWVSKYMYACVRDYARKTTASLSLCMCVRALVGHSPLIFFSSRHIYLPSESEPSSQHSDGRPLTSLPPASVYFWRSLFDVLLLLLVLSRPRLCFARGSIAQAAASAWDAAAAAAVWNQPWLSWFCFR